MALSFSLSLSLIPLFVCVVIFFLPSSRIFAFSLNRNTSQDDEQSLLAFKSLIIPNGSNMADWSPATPLCKWSGVICSGRRERVVALNLTTMNLRGTISPSLGNLSFLRSLDLSNNYLHGRIPTQLGRLFRLKLLYLYLNQLEGSIPAHLANCSKLVEVYLTFNNLGGNIPKDLGSLAHLQALGLGANSFTGTIPPSLGNLSSLFLLAIPNNNLSGAIPPQLGLLSSLQQLYLYDNKLSGSIPASLSNISSLTMLSITDNRLTHSIPKELGMLTNLQKLKLYNNELTGTIPASLSNISTLTVFEIYINKLSGQIPSEFGAKLSNLRLLSLWDNQLSGSIPISIGNCSKLTLLFLSANKLSGSVPVELGKLSLLEKLSLNVNQLHSGSTITMPFITALTNCSLLREVDLTDNNLSGILPHTIGKLSTHLSGLSLSNNTIKGNVPLQIGNLSNLTDLDLSENLFNGNIPSLQSLKNIERLYLGGNKLKGNIPDDFEHLKHLGLLDISRNMLSGQIPNSLHHLKQLRVLSLHHNYLSHKIPAKLRECENLESLDLSYNTLSGSIPLELTSLPNLLFYLNLSWNLLDGSLPMEIGKSVKTLAIDISGNQLTGFIPATLGSCTALESLNLSSNAFEGSIPDSLGNLQNLIDLDLSSNFLSGAIPASLTKLKMLGYLNLSFNKLTGEISEGFFANQTINISLIGNSGLCGPQVILLPACAKQRSQSALVKKVILPIVGAIAFILCCLFLGFLWRGNLHQQISYFSLDIYQKLKHRRISYQELATATNGFSEVNLLGIGSFGSVYKGILGDGTSVAVKVLNLLNSQVEKSFKAECNVLQMVRHRNLLKIITSCSNFHFKGLVFEFLSNGSLEKHLYPLRDDNNDENVCELGFKTRLDIAIDVAHAMEYLHHDSPVQVVHCDLKPSNVILDEDMTGHVTDFGIARLIGGTSEDSLTSTLSLKGSIGYIAPEYGLGERISIQGDVYSYGILLLEMFTRKRPTSNIFVGDLSLHKWVNLAFPNKVEEVIDKSLYREVDEDKIENNDVNKCLISLLRVGLFCSKDLPQERPTMRDVVTVLESLREDLVGNTIAFNRERLSINNLLGSTDAARNVVNQTSVSSSYSS